MMQEKGSKVTTQQNNGDFLEKYSKYTNFFGTLLVLRFE